MNEEMQIITVRSTSLCICHSLAKPIGLQIQSFKTRGVQTTRETRPLHMHLIAGHTRTLLTAVLNRRPCPRVKLQA